MNTHIITLLKGIHTYLSSKLSSKQDTLIGTGDGQNIKSINGVSILGSGDISIQSNNVLLKKDTDLLYEVKYDVLDYDFAKEYFSTHYIPTPTGSCSVVRKGNKIGRNLDWYYDNEVEFVVETESGLNRHAVKGFAGAFPSLTKDVVANGVSGDLLKILPFRMLDGINDVGLMCNVNVVNPNATKSISDNGTTPLVEERESICTLMIVRYILDNFSTVDDACNYIKDYVKVYAPIVNGNKTEVQVFLADKTKSCVLSFEGENVVVNEDTFHGVLTNFRLSDTVLDNSGLYSINGSNIEDLGSGIERANIALTMLDGDDELDDIMSSLLYTHAYEENSDWYTEFVGLRDTTIHSDESVFQEIQNSAREKYLAKSRENVEIWHTTHSVIYDLDDLSAEYTAQEIDDGNSFEGKFGLVNYNNIHMLINDIINLTEEEIIETLNKPI